MFNLVSNYSPTGDQPQAIEKLSAGIQYGLKNQVLLGVTGSGKTFTMANLIRDLNMPALIISHNKTLAGQLYQEMRDFFPHDGVSYFVSYYDYYQPEAYIPQTDTYIEKEATTKGLAVAIKALTEVNVTRWVSVEQLETLLKEVATTEGLSFGDVLWPVRVALSGVEQSPSPAELAWILGREESLRRLESASKKL